jgi:hypothetical protein
MPSVGYQRRCRRNQRRGIDQIRAVKGDIEATCVCGAPTAAIGLCTTLRPTGQAFANYVVLCEQCVALAEADGMEVVRLQQRTQPAHLHSPHPRRSRPSHRCHGGKNASRSA